LRLVVDTNVIVAGLLRADGPPGRIVDSILRRSYTALYDDRILRMYETVLIRPRFGFDANAVAVFVGFIRDAGERIVAPSFHLRCSDEADQPFLDVAVEAAADALVTGNRRHFPAHAPVRIVTPAELMQLVR
jgi:putative PIN family toxin of toxin-antitoxin system